MLGQPPHHVLTVHMISTVNMYGLVCGQGLLWSIAGMGSTPPFSVDPWQQQQQLLLLGPKGRVVENRT